MNFKKLSSGVVASIILASNISFANELVTDFDKGVEEVVERINGDLDEGKLNEEEIDMEYEAKERESIINKEEKEDIEKEKSKEAGNNSRSARYGEVQVNFELGKTVKAEISRFSGCIGNIELPSKGTLSISATIPNELKEENDYLWVYIYDKSDKIVDTIVLRAKDWEGQNKFTARTGLKGGSYKIKFDSSYSGDMSSDICLSFKANENTELEMNDSEEEAQGIKVGVEYKGTTNSYNADYYKITCSKDMKVKVKIKETKSINKNDEPWITVILANGKEEYCKNLANGESSKDLTLKKGVNYISVTNDSAMTDYTLNVTKVVGPFMPVVDRVGDSYNFVSGETEKGTKVYVKVGNGSYRQANISSNGTSFILKTGKIKAGTEVRVYAKNSKGENSSTAKVICEDTTAPSKPKINKFTVKSTKLTGKTEANASVRCRIGGDKGVVFDTKADKNGKYSIQIGKYKRGVKIEVQASDKNKNHSAIATSKVENYVSAPKIGKFSNINVTFSGTADKGTTVHIKANGKNYKATTDSKGKFSVKIPKQAHKSIIKVYAKDKNGDTSVTVSKEVGYAPKKPTINSLNTKSTKVAGKTSKNVEVTVKIGSKSYVGKANSKGEYSIKIPKQKKNTKVTVQAKFASNGLKSYIAETKVK